ncbi:hypothetical protein HYW55_00200 [Candidatus Gottesmanbacteria bacterium]|nr:hypothetical protein [Candidatus Gottesmanbacteria bacterium]
MKVLFFGSSPYCLPLLSTLSKNTNLVGIISTTRESWQQKKVPVWTVRNKEELKGTESKIASLHPDIAIVSDFGLIIPKEIFEIPKYKTLNIHFSKLPKYRGASPIQYTILHGEKSVWISVQLLRETLDTGDIIWQKEIPLFGFETTGDLYPKLFEITSNHITDILQRFIHGEIIPLRQNEKASSYTRKLTRDDGFLSSTLFLGLLKGEKINWSNSQVLFEGLSAEENPTKRVEQAVRAFFPWPGVWTEIQITVNSKQLTKKLKILKAHLEASRLVPDIVQLEGKKPVSWKQFLEGYPGTIDNPSSFH